MFICTENCDYSSCTMVGWQNCIQLWLPKTGLVIQYTSVEYAVPWLKRSWLASHHSWGSFPRHSTWNEMALGQFVKYFGFLLSLPYHNSWYIRLPAMSTIPIVVIHNVPKYGTYEKCTNTDTDDPDYHRCKWLLFIRPTVKWLGFNCAVVIRLNATLYESLFFSSLIFISYINLLFAFGQYVWGRVEKYVDLCACGMYHYGLLSPLVHKEVVVLVKCIQWNLL